jgi:uncharacterized protein with PQ loop repeat
MITLTDALGFIGGIILSICMLPQLSLMYQTKSAKDISMLFTILYSIGLVMTAIYMTLIRAWAGAIPIWIETFLALILLSGKFFLDRSAKDSDEHNTIRQERQETMFTDKEDSDHSMHICHVVENPVKEEETK